MLPLDVLSVMGLPPAPMVAIRLTHRYFGLPEQFTRIPDLLYISAGNDV